MNAVTVFRALGPIDLRSVVRDSMLRWLVALPVLIALLLRWGVPVAAERVSRQYSIDLLPYYPLIVSIVVLVTPMVAGTVIGFLLLDQRDDRTLSALQVTPLTLAGYLAYRLAVPVGVSVVMTAFAVPLTGLVRIGPLPLLLVGLAAAPLAPAFALLLGAFAHNKVQGFAIMKAAGILNWPPIIAWFLPTVWQWAMGIVPTYWPVKVFWMLETGEAGWWGYLAVGTAYQLVLLWALLRRFNAVIHR
jgi:fluoroquinolone transport system permease protein